MASASTPSAYQLTCYAILSNRSKIALRQSIPHPYPVSREGHHMSAARVVAVEGSYANLEDG